MLTNVILFLVVSINQVQINGQTFFWSIISRRSVHKAGTRFYSRGINDYGQVANYVETEQIVEYSGQRLAFVQVNKLLTAIDMCFMIIKFYFFLDVDSWQYAFLLASIAQYTL